MHHCTFRKACHKIWLLVYNKLLTAIKYYYKASFFSLVVSLITLLLWVKMGHSSPFHQLLNLNLISQYLWLMNTDKCTNKHNSGMGTMKYNRKWSLKYIYIHQFNDSKLCRAGFTVHLIDEITIHMGNKQPKCTFWI